jgi:L-lactate dehydrogenase complex protein LldG
MRQLLGASVRRALLPGAELTHPGRFTPPADPSFDLVDRFRAELTRLGGVVHEANDRETVAALVLRLLGGASQPKILAWDDEFLPVPGIAAALESAGVTVLRQSAETADSREHRAAIASAALGLTGADAGLAETGSIVVASSPGRGRLASLVTPIHVALLQRSLIVESLPVLIGQQPDLVTRGANFVCITGPSRTADIEHVLATGVHGPKEIHVVIT